MAPNLEKRVLEHSAERRDREKGGGGGGKGEEVRRGKRGEGGEEGGRGKEVGKGGDELPHLSNKSTKLCTMHENRLQY